MEDVYFDSCLLVKLYLDEPGAARVRVAADGASALVSAALSRAEFSSAIHRQVREKALTAEALEVVLDRFADDRIAGRFHWLPASDAVLERVDQTYRRLPADFFLRAADALHLATAAEAGFTQIHSSDARLLKAAPRFRLKGVDPTR